MLTDALRRSKTSLLKDKGLDAGSAFFPQAPIHWVEVQSNMEQVSYGYISSNLKETVLPRIPDQEFSERISKVQAKMRAQRIDLLVAYSNAFDPGRTYGYFSDVVGINEAAAIVIPSRGDAIVCAGQASQAWAAHKSESAWQSSALCRR